MRSLLLNITLTLGLCAAGTTPVIIGHRGSNVGVESSREALEEGARRGYTFIESDIRVSRDSAYVLSHDETTARLGSGLVVADTTADALCADTLIQTRWGKEYTGHMATLDDMFDICRRYGTRPLIELKWATGINSNDTSGIPALIDFITSRGMRQHCMILTSMKPCLEFIQDNYPDIALQLLVQTKVDENYDWCVSRGIGIDIHRSAVTPEVVGRFHDAGLEVNVWTVNTPEEFEYFTACGVDYITTDSLTQVTPAVTATAGQTAAATRASDRD